MEPIQKKSISLPIVPTSLPLSSPRSPGAAGAYVQQEADTEAGSEPKGKSFFTLGKKKKDKKREIQRLTDENHDLEIKVEIAERINDELLERMQNLVRDHPYKDLINLHGSNVQIGTNNTIYTVGDIEAVLEDVENLADKLTSAIEENTAARSMAENKLRNAEIQLKEITYSLEGCKTMLAKMDTKSVKNMDNLKSLLEGLCKDRSDEAVLKEGVKAFCGYMFSKKQKVTVPASVKLAVNRIIDKFDFTNFYEFASMLNVDPTSIDHEFVVEEADEMTKVCVNILCQWIKESRDSNGDKLYGLVNEYEQERYLEMKNDYKKGTLGRAKSRPRIHSKPDTSLSKCLEGGIDERSIIKKSADPDKPSQFMHFLESMRYQVATEHKLSDIRRLVEDIHGVVCGDTDSVSSPNGSITVPKSVFSDQQ
ncbi:uncharacterized protein LOC128213875 [Mya arenaria]|uniref:uncharacterized protein LOC128213875 n=1 Tax=Mya arenaria TaxID=6604 RepID=UPI0022E2A471|nr:uncharacterized protein LOC128213875 [Mya arenaria]